MITKYLYPIIFFDQEREERKQKLKRERPDDRPTNPPYASVNDHLFHTKNQRTYDKSRLPPGKFKY